MTYNNEDRAVSEVLGFILLFAILILGLSFWQLVAVPAANADVEGDHRIAVQGDLQELRDGMEVAREADRGGTARVELGPRYPERVLFVNPPPPVGTLETVAEGGEIAVANATAVDREPAGVRAAWNGSTRSVETSLLAYDVGYNELESAPSYAIEHSFLYADADGRVFGLTDRPLVDGTDVRLTAVTGSLAAQGRGEAEIRVDPASPATRSVTVAADGGPVTIRLPTRLNQSQWEAWIAEGDDAHVVDVTVESGPGEYDIAAITLEEGPEYDIDLAAVDVGEGDAGGSGGTAGDGTGPTPAYLASPTGNGTVYTGGTARLSAEVRDRYDNVLAGESVTFEADEGAFESGTGEESSLTVTTGDRGLAAVRYVAPDEAGTDTVTISGDGVAPVTVTIDVVAPDDAGSVDGGDVRWVDDDVELAVGETAQLEAEAGSEFDGAPVTFDVGDSSALEIRESDTDDRFAGGTATLTVEAIGASAGSVYAYVSSLGSGDRLPIEVVTGEWVWETAADWAAGTDDRTASDDVGDREADTVRLGYAPTDGGLVGYWPFDGGAGTTAVDASGTGNDGTREGAPTTGVEGLLGSTAYELDGEDDHVRVPHDESLEMSDGDAVSVSMWVNQNEDLGRSWTALLQKSDASYNLQLNGANQPEFTIHTPDGGWQSASAGDALQQDRWYHLVGVYDGDEVRLYVDGELADATPVTGEMSDASASDVGIGENLERTGRHFSGRIDEPRLYDRALGEAEVDTLYRTAQSGTHTTGWKTGPRTLDSDGLVLNATDFELDGGEVTVTVESRTGGAGGTVETSDPIGLVDGVSRYDVRGIATDAEEFRLRVEFETPAETRTPVVGRLEVTDEVEADESTFAVSDFEAPDAVFEGETIDATATVSNVGGSSGTGTVEYRFGGTVVGSTDVTLDAGEETTVEFEHEVTDAPGAYDHAIRTADDDAGDTVQVLEAAVAVNFQPPAAEREADTPTGYLPDEGAQFGDRPGGYRYGWLGGENVEYRERNTAPDVRNDTLIHMDHRSADLEVWAVELPNGTYDVTLGMGDPDYTDSNHTVRVEGSVFEAKSDDVHSVTHEGTVEVTDGRLEIDPDVPGGDNQKLNYVELTRLEVTETDLGTRFGEGRFEGTSTARGGGSGELGVGYVSGADDVDTGMPGHDALVGQWRLDEDHGADSDGDLVADDSGEGNDGTTVGRIETGANGTFSGRAFRFDGTDDHVEIGHADVYDREAFAVNVWFKTDGHDDRIGVLSNKQDPGGQWRDRNWWLTMADDWLGVDSGAIWFRTSGGGTAPDVDLTADGEDYRDGEWHMATAVLDGESGEARLYVDGELKDEDDAVGVPDTPDAPIQVGSEVGGNRHWQGEIDQHAVFDRALTATEVERLYFDGTDGTFEGNYTSPEISGDGKQNWLELDVDATVPAGTNVTVTFRALDGDGEVVDSQSFGLDGTEETVKLDVASTERAAVRVEGRSTVVERTWRIPTLSVRHAPTVD
ncbi:MAG: LamG-like jellyroll fold domain-containing protein [Haloferacaceae archaeon]